MKHLKSKEIRKMWLEFFKSKGHKVEDSAPLVPINDPTLLWINAGVAPLKKYFDGSEKPSNPRITNAQKCIRTNDIENVGKTARHHTFFEMLGNFSIGDYFKNEAIEFAVELLTSPEWFGFEKEKLYMTYYPTDKDAYNRWVSLGIDPTHLIPLEGNFWEIGEGPCGPDSEIFYDRGEKYDPNHIGIDLLKKDMENDRYIEIWNIVFSQFNSKEELDRKDYPELPNKNIDTGCGLERLCCVMQEVETNYDSDLFMPIINKIEDISGVKYEGQMAFKVIADHIRTVTFAISDGATLSNEGRGYVLRRVLRRATKYGKKLGINKPFMYTLVDTCIEVMDDFYPYLHEHKDTVKKIVKMEEEKFLETLASGEKKFDEIVKNSNDKTISGKDAFMLYDTFGFPLELTIESALDLGFKVDEVGFKEEMDKQKNRARNARGQLESMGSQNEEYLAFKDESEFIGYEMLESTSKVIAVFDGGIVLDKTPFYATSGGQVCDQGLIDDANVLDVSKMPNGQFIHKVDKSFSVGQEVKCVVNEQLRESTKKNHSAAHLVHKSLKLTLGNHVHQQGQQVGPKQMRFDFNNYSNLNDDQIRQIEQLVLKAIEDKYPVKTNVMAIEEAKKTGAEALFGEKYGSEVRVVDMGYSIEFCGGTHVSNTADLKDFGILSVESIGSGLFRITAVTGDDIISQYDEYCINQLQEANTILDKINKNIIEFKLDVELPKFDKVKGYQYIINLRNYINNLKELSKQIEKEIAKKKSSEVLSDLAKFDSLIKDNKLVAKVLGIDGGNLKQLADALLNKIGKGVVFLASVVDDKIIFVSKNNINIHSGNLVKEACLITDGKGGGKPDMAQGGGKDISKLDEALEKINSLI